MEVQRSTIKEHRKKNYRLRQKILNLEQLIVHLRGEEKINDNCFSFLKVRDANYYYIIHFTFLLCFMVNRFILLTKIKIYYLTQTWVK